MDNRKLTKGHYISFIILGLIIIYGVYKTQYNQSVLKTDGNYTIARVFKINYSNYRFNANYTYEIKGKWYKSYQYLPNGNDESLINKFFKLKYSKKNPNISEILLDIEVIDTVLIRKAGFILKN